MQTHQNDALNSWKNAAFVISAFASLGCTQPPPLADTSMPTPSSQIAKDKNSATQRIMARLDGLSGDSDPRLTALRSRFEKLGYTVMAMGVSAATPSTAVPKTPHFSSFIVVAFDPAKNDIAKALEQVRSLETFTYVEADQMLQQRK
jgi:hypothetical protein